MNKRNREQLKASIARDLVEGQGEHSATRDLLKQYAPLEGIVTPSASKNGARPERHHLVEKSTAPHATVARNQPSPWHDATVAQPATVAPPATMERLATVKGELRVPNTLNFSLFPTLDPFAKAVYYQLFLLSHGFRRNTCIVGLAKLAKSVLMSQRKVQDTINYLEKRGLIRRLRAILGGPSKGNVYQVLIPVADMAPGTAEPGNSNMAEDSTQIPYSTLAPTARLAPNATNKDGDDHKKQSSSKSESTAPARAPVENHNAAAAPRERQENDNQHFALVSAAYEKATGNRWKKSDTQAYEEHALRKLSIERIVSVLEAVSRRTPARINSLRYFLKEILSLEASSNRAWQKKQFERIVHRVRDCSVGQAGKSTIDFLEDVKCAREGVVFDDDIYNELGAGQSIAH